MWRRIREILRKEFRQVLRDPRLRSMLIGPPLIQLLVFGYAVNLDVEDSRIAWMDQDRTPASRELRDVFQGSRNFQITATPASDAEMQRLMDHGRVDAVVRVLPGFGRDIRRGKTAPVQILVDGTNSNTASIVAANAGGAVASYGNGVLAIQMRQRMVARTLAAGGPVNLEMPALTVRSRAWFNPDLRSRNYFVPGVVVNIITLITLSLTAMAIVREREIGTMEQLMVTPIRPVELILGKTLPFALIGLADVLLVTGAALLIFHIPLRGSLLLLLFSSTLFLLTTLGVGLFISTISHSMYQAQQTAIFVMFPMTLLSGFLFPVETMPPSIQVIAHFIPLTYYIRIVRGIVLKGNGLAEVWQDAAILACFGVLVTALSALRLKKRIG
jgi:ABC-2 type transport system permease protein